MMNINNIVERRKLKVQSLLKGLACLAFFMSPLAAFAQSDTINRVVEVEREFQPVIEGAGKVDVKPQVYETTTQPAKVTFSDYSSPLKDIDSTDVSALGFSPTNFMIPRPLNGFLRGGIGHSATLFDFNYRLTEKRNFALNLNAHHLGQWGRKTLSHSSLGMDMSYLFSKGDFFFGVNAENIFFTRYGKYFEYDFVDHDSVQMRGKFSDDLPSYAQFTKDDKCSQWDINTKIGIRSLPNADTKYLLQTGYEAFIMKQGTTEHIVNTQAMIDWAKDVHHIGADFHLENHIYSFDKTAFQQFITDHGLDNTRYSTDTTSYHAIKLQPYYAYEGNRFQIHLGVNLDFCAGKGKVFLPSPNVTFEAKLTPTWLALYGGAVGEYATQSVREHFGYLRYLYAEKEIMTRANRTYTPINAFLGFKIRPHANLLMDIYADYRYTKYDVFFCPDTDDSNNPTGYFNLVSTPYQRWQIGARFHYHYQDIVFVSLNGFYNIWTGIDQAFSNLYALPHNHMLDRPTWGINLRIDGKIDSKWSVYTVNYFSGGSYILNLDPFPMAMSAKPVIDVNLGAQYNVNKWLSCYIQLNNIIHRKHDIVYGYQTQGINFLLGVSYAF